MARTTKTTTQTHTARPKSPVKVAERPPMPSPADGTETSAEATRSLETRPLPSVGFSGAPAKLDGEAPGGGLADGDATVVRPVQRPNAATEVGRTTLTPRVERADSATKPPPPTLENVAPGVIVGEFRDEVSDEVDEWSAADQPTVYLPPRLSERRRPSYLDSGDQAAWPPRPAPAQRAPRQMTPPPSPRQMTPPAAPRTVAPRPIAPFDAPVQRESPLAPTYALGEERLAAPDGRVAPNTPPPGVPRAALANPRMERFQELRQQRMALDPEQREAESGRPVAESVKQWWGDLKPGVERALHHQREARASGVHPLPAHAPAPATRLGDAFGRLSTSARNLTQRTQAAVAPTLHRLHDEAEQRAQALVERLEGSAARQQAPLLGPGRIAVFFQKGVSVANAQMLLANYQARPIRLIPRKQGFLAVVRPGAEAMTAERLRRDDRVRDVAYLEFDEYGQPIEPR